jgi:chromosome condensin MukBEF ATPase and DNA-binding subunit MukB
MKPNNSSGFRRILMVNWRDLHYAQVDLDPHITVFEGGNSAGKTSIMLAALSVLMPDKNQLRIRQVSQEKNAIEAIYHRLHPGEPISYAALEFQNKGERILAGVQITKSKESVSVDFSPFTIRNLPENESWQDLFRNVSENREWTCTLTEVAQRAGEAGTCFKAHPTLGAYFKELYDLGALPLPMAGDADRSQYAHLLETSMMGGLSQDLAVRLKNYLLPTYTKLPDAINRMQQNLLACLATKNEMDTSSKSYELLSKLFTALDQYTVAVAGKVQRDLRATQILLKTQEEDFRDCEKRLRDLDKEKAGFQKKLDELGTQKKKAIELLEALIQEKKNDQGQLGKQKEAVENPLKEIEETKRKYDNSQEEWCNAVAMLKKLLDEPLVPGSGKDLESLVKMRLDEIAELKREEERRLEESDADFKRLNEHKGITPAIRELAKQIGATLVADVYSEVNEKDGRHTEATLGPLVNGLIVKDFDAASKRISEIDPQLEEIWLTTSKKPASDLAANKLDAFKVVTTGNVLRLTRIPLRSLLGEASRVKRMNELKAEMKKSQQHLKDLKEGTDAFEEVKKPIYRMDVTCMGLPENDLNNSIKQLEKKIRIIKSESGELQAKIEKAGNDAEAAATKKFDVSEEFASQENTLKASLLHLDQSYSRDNPLKEKLTDQINKNLAEDVRLKKLWEGLAVLSRVKKELANVPDIGGKLQNLRTALLGVQQSEKSLQLLPESLPEPIDPLATTLPNVQKEIYELIQNIQPHNLVESSDPQAMIKALQDKISDLQAQLAQQQKNFRTNIDSIAGAINSEINKRSHKILRWSSDLKEVKFGKVRGIQMRLAKNEEQLNILEGLKVQKDLFAGGQMTLEEAIKKFFGQNLEISEALDYRRFVHLVIEVGDGQGKWRPVGGSTGEMIGASLSILIVLLRAWEDEAIGRGSVEPLRLLFLDEAARLDEVSHATLQSLSTSLQIQFIVAAPIVSASGRFTHYSVATTQTATGSEVIIRGRRKFCDYEPKALAQ